MCQHEQMMHWFAVIPAKKGWGLRQAWGHGLGLDKQTGGPEVSSPTPTQKPGKCGGLPEISAPL